MEIEQMGRQLRTAILMAEILEKKRHMILKYQANMMRTIREMEERENILCMALTNYLNDDVSNESEPECGDGDDRDDPAEEYGIAERASWCYTAGRELTESSRNPYWESQEG
jgi:hypothetical protein